MECLRDKQSDSHTSKFNDTTCNGIKITIYAGGQEITCKCNWAIMPHDAWAIFSSELPLNSSVVQPKSAVDASDISFNVDTQIVLCITRSAASLWWFRDELVITPL